MTCKWVIWIASIVGSLTFCANARAATNTAQPHRVRISYQAHVDCPNETWVMAQVGERTSVTWAADESEPALQIRLRLTPNGAGFVGRMEYLDRSGRTVVRLLEAPDCRQAAAGIALVTAMAIESQSMPPTKRDAAAQDGFRAAQMPLADAQTDNNSPSASPSHADAQTDETSPLAARGSANAQTDETSPLAARGSANPTVSPPTNASSPAKPRPEAARVASATPTKPNPKSSGRRPASVTVEPAKGAITQELGGLAGAVYGVGPGAAFGGGVAWGIGRMPFPWLRVGANWYEYRRDPVDAASFSPRFRVISILPQLCALHPLPGISELIVGLCGGIDVGQYTATGIASNADLFVSRTRHLFWASLQLAVPLRLAGSGLFFEIQPVVRLPLVAGSFEVRNPDQFVYEIPRVALGLNLALGLTFP